MTKNQKIIAWVSIVGSALIAGFGSAGTFFPDWTIVCTSAGGLIGAVVAFIVTRKSE